MKTFKFKAKIEAGVGGGAYVLFPYDTQKEFATRGKVPVKAILDGVDYKGSLIKYGNPQHMLGVLKTVRGQVGKGPGDMIEVVVWKDEETRTVEVPVQFEKAMKREGLLPFFEAELFPSQRVLPMDCRSQKGTNKSEETRESD